jgi:hypothetical protein
LPGLTPKGLRVTVMRAHADDNDLKFDVSNAIKLVLMIGDIRLKEEQTGVAGDVFVLDASIVTPSHVAKFTPAVLKKLFICIQVSDKFLRCLYKPNALMESPFHMFHIRN